MLNQIKQIKSSKPRVVYCNSVLWYPEKGVEGKTVTWYTNNINHMLFLNCGVQGASSIFDIEMRKLLLKWQGKVSMHDHLLQLIALTIGESKFVDIPLMLYRKHPDQVTSYVDFKPSYKTLLIKNSNIPVVSLLHYNTVKSFFEIYRDLISIEAKQSILSYLAMRKQNTFSRIINVFLRDFRIGGSKIKLISKIFLRPYINDVSSKIEDSCREHDKQNR